MNNRTRKKPKSVNGPALSSNTSRLHNKLNSALKHHTSGNLPKARRIYRDILKADPNNADASHMLGLVAYQSGDYQAAILLYNKVIEQDKVSAELYTNLGNALQSIGKFHEAVTAFRNALKINSNFVLAHNNLGNALLATGESEEAIDSFQTAIQLSPGYAQAHYNMGNALYAGGEQDKAIVYFKNALAIQPDFSDANSNLASVLMDRGEKDQAITLFRRALQTDQNNALAQHMLSALEGRTTATAPAAYVTRLFDGIAENFDTHLVDELGYRAPELISSAVHPVLGDAAKELDVIDLGCGTGLCGPLFRGLAKTLTGVDLSRKMLDKARACNVYDRLVLGEITTELSAYSHAFDLVIAADVFIYVGALREIFKAAAGALRPGGLFAFSLEADQSGRGYRLLSSGRYAHSIDYIRDLAEQAGLRQLSLVNAVLRRDKTEPIDGYIIILQA